MFAILELEFYRKIAKKKDYSKNTSLL